MIYVVSGLLTRMDGGIARALLTQRTAAQVFPYQWETPGGKVADDEGNREALARELREEIGVSHRFCGLRLWHGVFPRLGGRDDVSFALYHVDCGAAVPVAREGQGIGWFTKNEITLLDLAPGTKGAMIAIVDHLAGVEAR